MTISKQLKNIKLIVFDLDGTLLSDKGIIGTETKDLVEELRTKYGLMFSFASGRLHSAINKYAEELNISLPIISLDGAMIQSDLDGSVLHESFLNPKHVLKALRFSEQYFVNCALCHADAIYYTETNSAIPRVTDKFGALFKEVESYDDYIDNTLELFFAGDNRNTVTYLRDKMSFPFSWGTTCSFYRSQSKEGIFYLEVRKSGSTKGTGLKRLAKHFGIKELEVAVVGDWHNDIPMFETSAFRVAMSNAIVELKNKADIVTKRSNNEDGIAEFLSLVLKYKKGS